MAESYMSPYSDLVAYEKTLREVANRKIEEVPWLFPCRPIIPFTPDPYLDGNNWTRDPIPHYVGPITAQMVAERIVAPGWNGIVGYALKARRHPSEVSHGPGEPKAVQEQAAIIERNAVQNLVHQVPANQMPVHQLPAYQYPANQVSIHQYPAHQYPVNQASGHQLPLQHPALQQPPLRYPSSPLRQPPPTYDTLPPPENEWSILNTYQLKIASHDRGLDIRGLKQDLIDRLVAFPDKNFTRFNQKRPASYYLTFANPNGGGDGDQEYRESGRSSKRPKLY